MPNIIALLLCTSALGSVTFMWMTTFQDGDKAEKVMSSIIFIQLMIVLMLSICGIIWEAIST